jgi:uncharacterized membrane protein
VPPIALTTYELSLFVHITAVVVGFGATFAEAITFPVAMKVGKRHLPYVHRLQIAINTYFVQPALVLVLATGVYQASDADYDLGALWLSGAFVIVFALGALVGAYFIPADRKLAAMVERELAAAGDGNPQLSEEYMRGARNTGIAGGVAGLLVILAIYLMVTKPGL